MNKKKAIFFVTLFVIFIVSVQSAIIVYKNNKVRRYNSISGSRMPENRDADGNKQTNEPQKNAAAESKPIEPVSNPVDNSKKDDRKINRGEKIAYLTFDDGPSSSTTPKILDTLKNHNIKATFFVLGKNIADNKELFLREKNEGHAIGNHTYAHDPVYLYQNPKNLLEDFKKGEASIKEFYPDYKGKIVRFPGGSKNRPKQFKDAVKNAGYKSIDWNCLTSDAEFAHATISQLDSSTKKTFSNQKELIVLMHDSDGKDTTVEYLPHLIKFLEDNGYTFKTLK